MLFDPLLRSFHSRFFQVELVTGEFLVGKSLHEPSGSRKGQIQSDFIAKQRQATAFRVLKVSIPPLAFIGMS